MYSNTSNNPYPLDLCHRIWEPYYMGYKYPRMQIAATQACRSYKSFSSPDGLAMPSKQCYSSVSYEEERALTKALQAKSGFLVWHTTQISGIKVSTQRKCSSHDNPPIQGSHLESEIGPAGNPPHESVATASGINCQTFSTGLSSGARGGSGIRVTLDFDGQGSVPSGLA